MAGLSWEAVEVECGGRGDVVEAAFGDVAVARGADRGDHGASEDREGCGGPAGPAGGGVLTEGDVADVVLAVLDVPVLAGERREQRGPCLLEGEAGDPVGGLAGRRPAFHPAPAVDADRLGRVREVEVGDGGGLDAAGLVAAVAMVAGGGAGRDMSAQGRPARNAHIVG